MPKISASNSVGIISISSTVLPCALVQSHILENTLKSLTSFTLSGEGIRYGAVPVAGPRSTELSTPALGHAFTNTLRSSISTSLSLS